MFGPAARTATTDLRLAVPSAFDQDLFLSSPDEEFDRESLRSYKSLRAYRRKTCPRHSVCPHYWQYVASPGGMRWRRRKVCFVSCAASVFPPKTQPSNRTALPCVWTGQVCTMVLTAAALPAWERRAAMLQVFLHLRIFCKRLPRQTAGWPEHYRRAVYLERTQVL